jgi:hypothetical protein
VISIAEQERFIQNTITGASQLLARRASFSQLNAYYMEQQGAVFRTLSEDSSSLIRTSGLFQDRLKAIIFNFSSFSLLFAQ